MKEYGKRYHFPENVKLEEHDGTFSIIEKIYVEKLEKFEEAICEQIAQVAKESGVTDLCILNKKAIVAALVAAYPDNFPDVAEVIHAKWDDNGRCTNCGGHAPYYAMSDKYYESPYCFVCGAKMDKEEV